jgi:signal transduction histidine kinase/DNA-binding response OmpR family regulator
VISRYAGPGPGIAWERYQLGQGVLGQAALERRTIVLEQLPEDYPHVTSTLGEAVARVLIAVPLVHDGALAGAVELCLFRPVRAIDLTFLEQAQEALAIALSVTRSRQQVRELLVQSQAQEEELRVQQEELQQSNEELEERSNLLEEQREEIRAKNLQVEAASAELRQRAEEVQRISTYKSAFLANMSHELRTPLNSMMVLSSLLRDNKDGNLTARQVEFARTIHGSGRDLLDLINDILDLAKIESGRMEFQAEPVDLTDLAGQLRGLLEPLADQQGIGFQILLDPALPATLEADRQRLQQILKNLAANAVKFTAKGAVTVTIAPAGAGNPLPVPALAFAVADTGIGIAPEQLQAVFQAFRQADGTTSRKYGGTGLGLSISQQLATGMGGTIQLRSELGQGSTFTLYLPLGAAAAPATAAAPAPAATGLATSGPGAGPWLADDRALLKSGERAILIIEDDRPFAELLMSLVRDRGFKALAARDGAAGVELADSLQPSAIILDVMLPGMDGWTVMEQLRQGQRTRAIPVHFLTCQEDPRRAMAMGAAGFTSKPVTWEQLEGVLGNLEAAIARTVKRLLIVADDEAEVKGLTALLEARQVVIQVARTGAEAIRLHAGGGFDCVVLDLGLGDPSGFQVLEAIRTGPGNREVPVIIHSGRELAAEEERRLQPLSDSIIIKGAKSPERLLSEVTLFLHALGGGRSRPERARPAQARPAQVREAVMAGKKVLIVDDDMRNVFSLSSVFAEQDLEVLEAENGRVALAVLDAHPDLDLVLMDIMMPEMDGFEAMRRIRQDPRFRKLPIIALTAKAMKSDQEACLQAGASDYLTKPLDVDKLLSLMRVWLFDRA